MDPISSRFFELMRSWWTRRSLASSLQLRERNKCQYLAGRGWMHSRSWKKFGVYLPLCVKAGNVKLWQPIVGIIALGLFPHMQKWMRRRRSRALGDRTVAARMIPGFSNVKYGGLVASLPSRPTSLGEEDAFPSSSSAGQDQLHVFT